MFEGEALAAETMRWWSSGSWAKGTRQTVESQFWRSGEQTLTCAGIFLQESMGDGPGDKRDHLFLSNITSFKLKNGPSQWAGNQAKVTEGRHRWTSSSWQNWSLKRTTKWLRADQQHRLSKGKILPNEADSHLWWNDRLCGEEDIYLDCSKAFIAVYCNIPVDKLMKYRLGKWTVRQTENWLHCWA